MGDLISRAVHEGKIAPGRAAHYRRLMESDPEGTAALLASLVPVLPVREVGVAILPAERAQGSPTSPPPQRAYPREWLKPGEVRDPDAAPPLIDWGAE